MFGEAWGFLDTGLGREPQVAAPSENAPKSIGVGYPYPGLAPRLALRRRCAAWAGAGTRPYTRETGAAWCVIREAVVRARKDVDPEVDAAGREAPRHVRREP